MNCGKLNSSLAALSLFLTVNAAHALDCRNPQTQVDINQCAGQAREREDKELNNLYGEYRARLDDAEKQQFKEVQLAWIKFRDLACQFESAGVSGGSIYGMVMATCLAEKTRVRNKDLQALLSCKEGDLRCTPAAK